MKICDEHNINSYILRYICVEKFLI